MLKTAVFELVQQFSCYRNW